MQKSIENKLCIYSLFEWTPGASDILSCLLVALKGSKRPRAWRYWAQHFWEERVVDLSSDEILCLVPAPSSRLGVDHAQLFAMALADYAGAELIMPLIKLSEAHQRTKSRERRRSVQIGSAVKIAGEQRHKRYVLVDDVLTTGATAKACYEALGKPPHFEVWVLGKRGLSCELTDDLL